MPVFTALLAVLGGFAVRAGERVNIPEGQFTMGCDRQECNDNTAPAHTVTLSPYWIAKYEVTQAEWAACVAAGACNPPLGRYDPVAFANWPVVGITRAEAEGYCEAEGGRLPTEAEWERAALGTTANKFPWGDTDPDCDKAQLPMCNSPLGPVGLHPDGKGESGVEDLVGNAWELVFDFYEPYYYRTSPSTDPQGGTSQFLATVRGPSTWTLAHSEPVFRLGVPLGTRSASLGFRCAGSL